MIRQEKRRILRLDLNRLAKEAMGLLKNQSAGATFEALVTKDFESTESVIVLYEDMCKYNNTVAPVYETILLKQEENEKINGNTVFAIGEDGEIKIQYNGK